MRMRFRWLLLLPLAAASCATDVTDELAGEDGDGFDDGKADDAGAFTYYLVNGTSAAMLNKSTKVAIDAVDFTTTGLTSDEVARATTGKVVVVRATVAGKTLRATELWVGTTIPASGIFVKLRDADVRCTELACETHDEIKLNSERRARSGLLDFGSNVAAGVAANAQAAIGQSGLII